MSQDALIGIVGEVPLLIGPFQLHNTSILVSRSLGQSSQFFAYSAKTKARPIEAPTRWTFSACWKCASDTGSRLSPWSRRFRSGTTPVLPASSIHCADCPFDTQLYPATFIDWPFVRTGAPSSHAGRNWAAAHQLASPRGCALRSGWRDGL